MHPFMTVLDHWVASAGGKTGSAHKKTQRPHTVNHPHKRAPLPATHNARRHVARAGAKAKGKDLWSLDDIVVPKT